MPALPRFRSDYLRRMVREALDQEAFEWDWRGRHPALVCVVCGHREIITLSGRQQQPEIKKKACRLRRHGLEWEGRGGVHA